MLKACDDAETAALAQEQVHDDQIPGVRVLAEPAYSIGFGLCHPDRFHIGKLRHRRNQVVANRGIVFNKKGTQFHDGSKLMRWTPRIKR